MIENPKASSEPSKNLNSCELNQDNQLQKAGALELAVFFLPGREYPDRLLLLAQVQIGK